MALPLGGHCWFQGSTWAAVPFAVAFILLLHPGAFSACTWLSPLSAPYLDFFIGSSSSVDVPRLTFTCPMEVKMVRVGWGSKGHPLNHHPFITLGA